VRPLIPEFIYRQFEQDNLHGTMQAYAMFFDLSGFTSMTEELMKQGNEGAEALSVLLNGIFEPMVRLVYGEGGIIPHFAGDSFVAIFPQSVTDPRRVFDTACRILDLYRKEDHRQTPFGSFRIDLKIGVSLGQVEWGIVGFAMRRAFYFRGEAIDECARCQVLADKEDMVADAALHSLWKSVGIFGFEIRPGYYAYHFEHPVTDFSGIGRPMPNPQQSVLQHFFPQEVLEFDRGGEFRTVTALFLSFMGVEDHDAMEKLATVILEAVNGFSGYFKEIDFGDKGGVMVAFFGAPISFERITNRTLECALNISQSVAELRQHIPALRIRMGITSGTAFAGLVGGMERCQYAVVGNRVNIAARLMVNASWGEILVDDHVERERGYRFVFKGNITYKGLESHVPTFVLQGQEGLRQTDYHGPMVGRVEELDALLRFARPIFNRTFAGITYLFGEAGMGKSRLVHEFREQLRREGTLGWYVFQADQILRKPFNLFTYFLKSFFGQSPEKSPQANRKQFDNHFETVLSQCRSLPESHMPAVIELMRTRSILAALVGLHEDNSLWEQLDARGRRENTFSAVLNLIDLLSLISPVVLVMEDVHWLDSSSREMTHDLLKVLRNRPALLVLTARPDDDGQLQHALDENVLNKNLVPVLELDLGQLSDSDLRRMAEKKLGGPIAEPLLDLLKRTTNGNPFYAEQMIGYLEESNLLEKPGNGADIDIREGEEEIRLSDSINSILTARIDRLSTLVKETVKAAAVIGREFELPVLSEVMRSQEPLGETDLEHSKVLREQIRKAERGQIWQAMNELRYIFRHSLLREAVLDMQLRTRVRELHHLIARAMERLYADRLEERYYDLAYHYGQAHDREKAIEYSEKAADRFKRNFQNKDALESYEKLLALFKPSRVTDIARTMLKKGAVQELIGLWEDAGVTFSRALELAGQSNDLVLIGRANDKLGHLLILQGKYEDARRFLNTAASSFEQADDYRGIVKTYGNLGDLYFRQGMYEEARSYFTRSLEMAGNSGRSPAVAQIAANLGLTLMNQAEYETGIQFLRQQLAYCTDANNKLGMAILYTNLGIVYAEQGSYDLAGECYRQGLERSDELGNKQLMAIGTGCLGSVHQQKGEYETAMELFQKDLLICQELGDTQGIAIAMGLIGELYAIQGRFREALSHLQEYHSLSQKINYRKGVAKAVNTLGDVYFSLGDYDSSVRYYQHAVDIARKIDNKLVLAQSLVEQCQPLRMQGHFERSKKLLAEATELARLLSNPDLNFFLSLQTALLTRDQGAPTEAVTTLSTLLQSTERISQKALLTFELWKTTSLDSWKSQALSHYTTLQSIANSHTVRSRLADLNC
jgi:class 3 adenylate cyclase/tetratricopeptide (TPR) repeat protein